MWIERFLQWAHHSLSESDEAQEYLLSRGVSEDQWSKYNLGFTGGRFVPDFKEDLFHNDDCGDRDKKGHWCDTCRYLQWSSKWLREDESDPTSRKKGYPGMRIENSIVFPLTTYSGNSIGFQIRSIVQKQYDTYAITRRPEGYFFGTSVAVSSIWSRKKAFVVEGPFDCLLFDRLISPNVVALTTSSPGKSQVKFLRRFCNTIYSCLDRDKAGKQGFESLSRHLSDKITLKIEIPALKAKDKDLGDYWKIVGDDKFRSHFATLLENYL